MTIRNLQFAFTPSSVAVIGASPRRGSVGSVVLGNIVGGGFTGAIYPVNPKYEAMVGLRCYHRVEDLPTAPELAIIVTPAPTVPGLIAELGERGTKVAVVITAGIGEVDGLRQKMLDAAKPYLMRIIGPNTIGLLSPRVGLNASFVHLTPSLGRLGLISQSGAMVASTGANSYANISLASREAKLSGATRNFSSVSEADFCPLRAAAVPYSPVARWPVISSMQIRK